MRTDVRALRIERQNLSVGIHRDTFGNNLNRLSSVRLDQYFVIGEGCKLPKGSYFSDPGAHLFFPTIRKVHILNDEFQTFLIKLFINFFFVGVAPIV